MDILDNDSLSVIYNYLRTIDKLVLSFVSKKFTKPIILELMTEFLEKYLP